MRWGVNLAGGEFGEGNLPGVREQHYTYNQSEATMRQFVDMGLGLFRLPVRWERVQPNRLWAMRGTDVEAIRALLDRVQTCGGQAILELHNYGRFQGVPLGAEQHDRDAFRDIWLKLSKSLGNHPALYAYELMNEPHDLPGGAPTWHALAQEAVNMLRQIGDEHPILVPGYDWQSARRWRQSNETLNIADPLNKIIYSAHSYWDADGSGRYQEPDADDWGIGRAKVRPFIDWLEARDFRGAITEFGVPKSQGWLDVLEDFGECLNYYSCIELGTAWAAGPWWGDYALSLEPPPPQPPMPPQLAVLSRAAQGGRDAYP